MNTTFVASSSIAQKVGLPRKSFESFGDQVVLLKCFKSFILPCLEYRSPAWSSAVDSYLKLLDRNLRCCKCLIPELNISLLHRRSVSSLCMFYKIFNNPSHPPHSDRPQLFQSVRVTRYELSSFFLLLLDSILLNILDALYQLPPSCGTVSLVLSLNLRSSINLSSGPIPFY